MEAASARAAAGPLPDTSEIITSLERAIDDREHRLLQADRREAEEACRREEEARLREEAERKLAEALAEIERLKAERGVK